MKRSAWASLALAAILFFSLVSAAPAHAGYFVTVSGCTITINVEDASPETYTIGAVTGDWPYDSSGPAPSVSATMPASGTYLVDVDAGNAFRDLVTVNCDELPAEPLDPATTGDGDPDLVVDTIVLIEDTDGVIREGQAFARLLRPTYLAIAASSISPTSAPPTSSSSSKGRLTRAVFTRLCACACAARDSCSSAACRDVPVGSVRLC